MRKKMNKTQEKVLRNLLTQDEYNKAVEVFSDEVNDETIFDYLMDNVKTILAVDWSGEGNNGDIGTFLQVHLKKENKNITLDQDKIYNNLNKKIKAGDIERGKTVPFILENFNKILKRYDYKIMLLGFGNDTYYIILVSTEKSKILKKIKDEYWKFLTFEDTKREILYIVTCSCGEEAVFQLKLSEALPADEFCEKCGKQLFDKNGKALVPLEKEYL
jgi:hypothetical protein